MNGSDPLRLTCHCGGVELRVTLVDGLNTAKRCDCSFCRRRGAMTADVKDGDLEVIRAETLGTYQFGPKIETHHFCTRCGVYTHHRRPALGMEWGVNVGGLEGLNPADIDPVPWMDGKNWNPVREENNVLS